MDIPGKFGKHERSVRVALTRASTNSSFLSVLQSSQVHVSLDIGTAKSRNQFFNNMATTTWALKQVLFLIDYKVLLLSTVKESKGY